MAALRKAPGYIFSHLFKNSLVITSNSGVCLYSNDAAKVSQEIKPKLSGFAQAYEKQLHPDIESSKDAPQNFAALMRSSKFIDLGDPEGKIVTGKIFHVVDNDLYIDFGWKFHTVCPRPARNGEEYVRGATVRLQIRDLELSTRFLGTKTDLTLLEADCTLLGLVSSPART